MIEENLTTFYNLPVKDYEADTPLTNADQTAYRVRLDWEQHDSGVKFIDHLNKLLDDPAADQLKALVIGDWGGVGEGNGIEPVIEAIVQAKDKLASLEAIFLADLISEESEISWIQQGDISPLWPAYPGLIEIGVRGGEGLSLGTLSLNNLRKLTVEAGGLPPSIVNEIATANLPNLEHLEVWLGTDEYGGDCTMDDVQPILNSTRFPKLNYLGLKNSVLADDIAAAVGTSSVIVQLQVLDLSMGTLRDIGVEALAVAGNLGHLHKLDIHYHFATPEALAKLDGLGITIDASDPQEPDTYDDETYYYVAVSE